MWIRKIRTGACLSVISAAAIAQGSFDFDDIPGVDVAPTLAVNMGPVQIGLVRGILAGADPALATNDILNGLRSIQLRVYHDTSNARQFTNFIAKVTEELEDEGWEAIMAARDTDKTASIHMQMTAEQVTGMTVMLFDGQEAVFINIDGTISAEDLGRLLAYTGLHEVMGQMPPVPNLGMPPGRNPQPAPDSP